MSLFKIVKYIGHREVTEISKIQPEHGETFLRSDNFVVINERKPMLFILLSEKSCIIPNTQ